VEKAEAAALAEIKTAIHQNKDDVAALIIEPIQGEGGDNHFRAEFFRALRQICDESEVFFIVDEVQTGVALTGKFWAYQHYGFEPDAIAFGKKVQVCGVLVSARVDEVEANCFKESSRINSTWGGNLVDMVRSTRYLEVIERDRLIENCATVGMYALSKLEAMQKEFPAVFTNARGLGLYMAIDVVDPDVRPAIMKHAYDAGMLILPSGKQSIRFRPPVIAGNAEIDEACEILTKAVRAVGTTAGARA